MLQGLKQLKRLSVLAFTFALVVSAGQLVGCGQKGPLYLPDPEPKPTVKSEKTEQKASAEQTITK